MNSRPNKIDFFCNDAHTRKATKPASWPIRLIVVAVALVTSTRVVDGFTSAPNRVKKYTPIQQRQRTSNDYSHRWNGSSQLHLSSKEEAADPRESLEQAQPSSSSANDVLSDPSRFISQTAVYDTNIEISSRNNGISLPLKVASVAVMILLLLSTTLPSTVMSTYSSLLVEHPLPTKSLTSGVLCGVSDVIAQFRDSTRKKFNYGRLIRFAGKGCAGGIIWSFWYDNLDRFLDMDSTFNIFQLSGINEKSSIISYDWIRNHLAIVTTFLSIVIEQFFWCPIVFGTFEIPVSTLLNGGSVSTVRKEVDSKLNGLLVSNAKVWTLANIIIYNAPVEWRPPVSNCVDVLWQSIVSDVAADCGKAEDDVCEVVESGTEKDYSFYAEKSRL